MLKLYPYQREVVDILKHADRKRYAVFMDLGTGKTPIMLRLMAETTDWHVAVVICPAYLVTHWCLEAEKWAPDELIAINYSDVLKKKSALPTLDDKNKRRLLFVMSYAMLRRHAVRELSLATNFVVLDESIKIANPRPIITNILANPLNKRKITPLFNTSNRKYLLCGRPMTESELQIYSQYKFIRPAVFAHAGNNFYAWRSTYFVPNHYGNEWTLKPNMKEQFTKRLNSVCIRRTRQEVLSNLPGSTTTNYVVKMGKIESALYKSLKKEWGLLFDASRIALDISNALSLATKLQQLSSGFIHAKPPAAETDRFLTDSIHSHKYANKLVRVPAQTQPIYALLNTPKRFVVLNDLLKQIPDDAQFVVFCNFRYEAIRIHHTLLLQGKNVRLLLGGTKSTVFTETVAQYQTKKVRGLIATTASMSYGLNLSSTAYLIYFSHVHSYNLREQSEARPQRPGQTSKLTIINIIMKDTIDEQIMQAYKRKMSLDQYLTKGVAQ